MVSENNFKDIDTQALAKEIARDLLSSRRELSYRNDGFPEYGIKADYPASLAAALFVFNNYFGETPAILALVLKQFELNLEYKFEKFRETELISAFAAAMSCALAEKWRDFDKETFSRALNESITTDMTNAGQNISEEPFYAIDYDHALSIVKAHSLSAQKSSDKQNIISLKKFHEPGRNLSDAQTDEDRTLTSEPKIRGFLLLVGCWVVFTPILILTHIRDLVKNFPPQLREKLDQIPILDALPVALVLSILLAYFAAYILATIAFFRKAKIFPKFFIALLLGDFILNLGFTIITSAGGEKVSATDSWDLVRAGIVAAFWTFVFLRSERVKKTFVRTDPTVNFLFNKKNALVGGALTLSLPLLILLGAKITSGDSFEKLRATNQQAKNNVPEEKSSTEIAEMALDNLVVVKVYDKKKREIKSGSGFYFLTEDLIVTNYHVISGASYVLFRKANADEDDAEAYNYVRNLVAVDRELDLAIFRTKYKNKSSLPAGKASELEIGEKIYVAGNPRGFEGTFSDGLLSNKFSMDGIHHLQITAPISSGSSGGPLLNRKGEAVGIVTASIKKGQNLNLAIPSYYVGALLEKERDDLTSAQKPNLGIEITKKGRGKKAVAGDQVTVHYAGMLPSNKIFDSSEERDQPFTFTLGAGQVIEGWDQGIVGMRVGEERILKIPAELAYGSKGVGKVIPPNSPLTFGIRLLEIKSSDDRVGH